MPNLSGQQVFAYILHGLELILTQAFLRTIRVVLVFGRAFQQDAVFPGYFKYITVHLSFQGDAFGLFQVVRFFKMIDHFRGAAKGIAYMKADVIGVLYRVVLDWYRIVQVGDDGDGLAGLLPCGSDCLIGGEVAHKADEDGDGHSDENEYNDL